MSTDRGLRIGDRERADAADRLSAHAAAGRLGVDELEERVEQANRAVFAGELLAVEADLPASVDRRRRGRHRPPPALIIALVAAAVVSLLIGHPIAPLFIVLALVWRAGRRDLRTGHPLERSLP